MHDDLHEIQSRLIEYEVKRERTRFYLSPTELIALDQEIERLKRRIEELTQRSMDQRAFVPENVKNILLWQIERLPDKSKSVSVLCEGSMTDVLGYSSSRVENGADYITGGHEGGKEPSKV